jgi:hypothetical protein
MKKCLILCLVFALAFAMAATAKKMDPRTNLITKDGDAPVGKASGAKLPGVGIIVSATGYADAWRATAGMAGKSIVVDPTGTTIGMAFGVTGSPCDLVFGYSLNGGATWDTMTFAGNMNTRIYNGLALDSINRPYIVWQDRNTNSIVWSRDEGGIGGGSWTDPDTLVKDSVGWYLPTIAIGGSNLIISATSFSSSTHYALSHDLGATWIKRWDSIPNLSAEVDWMFSGSGDTVVAFLDVVVDTVLYEATGTYGGFGPAYKLSYDSGLTWTAMQKFDLPPQYKYGGWWYMYDGAWIGDRPFFLYTHQDDVWNGNGLFVYFPTVAGDYSDWTIKRISDIPGNLAGVTPGDRNGSGVNFPTLSSDAAGNIFAIYSDYPKNSDNYEIFGVASTDGGITWLNPVQLTTEAGELDGNIYLEAAEFAGGDKIHMLFHDPAYTNIYYWSVSTSTILAETTRPREISVMPDLVGSDGGGWGGPAIDSTMDTVSSIGDTLKTYWSPKIGIGGAYEINICKSEDFSSNDSYRWSDDGYSPNYINVNYLTTIGLPDTNVVWYWRVRSVKADTNSPWSYVNDFYYKGTTVNTINWYVEGVEGTPTSTTVHKFALNQNRPNPVNKVAELSFTLPRSGSYRLKIYNISGQLIRTLDGKGEAGQNKVTWNGLDNSGRKAANGVYLYNLNAFGNSATKKMVVLR